MQIPKRVRFSVSIIAVATAILWGQAPANCSTILVSPDGTADYATIQAGLNAGSPGDTVLALPGIYSENIIWPATDSVRLASQSGAQSTIIDGERNGRVISISTGVNAIIEGFTIQNGLTEQGGFDPWLHFGGGILLQDSSATIAHNILTNNEAWAGGAIALWNSNGDVRGNTILNNIANLAGGGIEYVLSTGVIQGNRIEGNVADLSSGGIEFWASSGAIHYNEISNNTAQQWNGGGILFGESSGTISGNYITGNSAGLYGGAITVHYDSNAVVDRNMITGNSAALFAVKVGEDSILNASCNVIAHNTGGGLITRFNSEASLRSNNIFDNGGFGVFNEDSSVTINAELNWWGNPSGPSHSSNPSGVGDPVSDHVTFAPWLTSPSTCVIPEPSTMLLFGTGIAGLAGSRIRRKKK